jgi:murein DD-endopeptidase MepM/ murein hydrolase activator NlpD
MPPTEDLSGTPDLGMAEPTSDTRASPTPAVYVIVQGDTLGAIAEAYGVSVQKLVDTNQLTDPDVLHLGQQLIIPARAATPTAAPSSTDVVVETPDATEPVVHEVGTPPPTPTSAGPPLVEIVDVAGASNLVEEVVVIRNRGGATSLEGWTLSDGQGASFLFPAVIIYTDAEVRLHSRSGTHGPSDLYWGLVEPAWNGGELLTLRDDQDNVVDTYIVP